MRRYETIVIVDPDISDEDRTSLFSRVKEIIPQQEGVLIKEDLWGTKKLAYEIKKRPRGFYALFDYCGMGPVVDELERFFRIDDRVMKYITVLLAEEADAEKILAEMTQEASTEDAAASPAEETAQQPETPETKDEPAGEEAAETATETTAESATESSEKE